MSQEMVWDSMEGKFVPKYAQQSGFRDGNRDSRQNRGGQNKVRNNQRQSREGQNEERNDQRQNRGGQNEERNEDYNRNRGQQSRVQHGGGNKGRGNTGSQSDRDGINRDDLDADFNSERATQYRRQENSAQSSRENRGGQNRGGYRGGQSRGGNRGGQNVEGNRGGQNVEDYRGGQNMGGNRGGQNMGGNRGGQNMGGNRGGQNMEDNRGGQNMGGNRGGQNMEDYRGGQNMEDYRGGQNMGGNRGGQNMGGNRGGQNMGGNRGGQNMGGNRGGQNMGGNRGGQNMEDNRGRQNMGGNRGGQNMGSNRGGQNMGSNRGGQNMGGNRGGQNMGGNRGRQNMGGNRGGQNRRRSRGSESGNREEQEFPRDSGGYESPSYAREGLLPTPPVHTYPFMAPGPGPVPPMFYPPPPHFPPPLRPPGNLIPGKDSFGSFFDIPNLQDGRNQGRTPFQKGGNHGRLPRSTSTPNVNNTGRVPQPNRQPPVYRGNCSNRGARQTNVGGRMNYAENVGGDNTGGCFEEEQRDINDRSRRGRTRGMGYGGRTKGMGYRGRGKHVERRSNGDLDDKQHLNAENNGDGGNNRRGRGRARSRPSRRGGRHAKRGRDLKLPHQGWIDPSFESSDENSSISGSTLSLVSGVSEQSEIDVTYDLKLDDLDVARILTLRNRLKRYKFKLGELRKMDIQDTIKIQAFEEALVSIKHAIDKKKTSEAEKGTSKRKSGVKDDDVAHENHDPKKDTCDNLENEESIIVKLPKKTTTMSVKKGMVSFNPKRNRKKNPKATPVSIVVSASSSEESVSSFEDEIEVDSKVETKKEPKGTDVSKAKKKAKVPEKDKNQIDALMSQLDGLCNISQKTEDVLQNLDEEKKSGRKKKVKAKGQQAANNVTQSPSPGLEFVFTDEQSKLFQSEPGRPNKSKQNEPRQTSSHRGSSECIDKNKESFPTIREPDVNEVFKFLVKKLAAEASMETIVRESGLFPANFDVGKWFKSNRNRFTLIERNCEIVNVMAFNKSATYCLDYITRRSCDKPDCSRYHICKDFLCGHCVFGDDGCKFSHDTLDRNSRNLSVSKAFGYDNVFTNAEIRLILKVRYPHVCVAWNEEGYCGIINCTGLHICQRFLLGTCFEDRESCSFSHDKDSLHNKAIIEAYHMDKWNDNVFKRMVYIVRSPRVAWENNTSDKEESEILQQTESEKSQSEVQEEPFLLPIQERHRTPKGTTMDRKPKEESKSKEETTSGAKIRQKKRTDDISISSDNLGDNFFICDASIKDKGCNSKSCRYKHLEERMPYIWQIKAFGMWLTFPLSEAIEFAYCNKDDKAVTDLERDSNIYHVEVKFEGNLHALVNMSGIEDGQDFAEVRRLSTPSYLAGKFTSQTYRTQWRWYFFNEQGSWDLYEPNMQYTLEQKFLAGQKEYLFSRENYRFKYQLSFNTMTQMNLDTGKCRAIIRRPLFVSRDLIDRGEFAESMKTPPTVTTPLPPGWVPWDLCHPFEFVKLSPKSSAYKDVAKSFFKTLDDQRYVIDDIFRVQNHVLWSSFCNEETLMQANLQRSGRDTAVVDKRTLFHGTDSLNAVRGIAINNFDFRISGKHGTVYGNGAYFARDAKYSNSYTEIADQERYMFRASVLVGEFTKGQEGFGRPPSKHGNDHELYDSCVDNVAFPTVFVSFDRAKCYPEFLITYHDSRPPVMSDDVLQTPKRRPAPRAPTSIAAPSPTSPTSTAVPPGASSSFSSGASYPYGASLDYPMETVHPNLNDPYATRQTATRGNNEVPKSTKKKQEGCCIQ